jgi:hypothetical protein
MVLCFASVPGYMLNYLASIARLTFISRRGRLGCLLVSPYPGWCWFPYTQGGACFLIPRVVLVSPHPGWCWFHHTQGGAGFITPRVVLVSPYPGWCWFHHTQGGAGFTTPRVVLVSPHPGWFGFHHTQECVGFTTPRVVLVSPHPMVVLSSPYPVSTNICSGKQMPTQLVQKLGLLIQNVNEITDQNKIGWLVWLIFD